MNIVNFPTVAVNNTTGAEILTSAQAQKLTTAGLNYVGINPSVDIVLVDPSLGTSYADVPLSTAGTAANSPWTCTANTVTTVEHRSGALRAIGVSGAATVKISGALAP